MASLTGSRFRELMKKYGKVALGVHFTVSAASITGLYVAIKNNVDVESLIDKLHMGSFYNKDQQQPQTNPTQSPAVISSSGDGFVSDEMPSSDNLQSTEVVAEKKRNRTAELVASSGGALTMAILCNKALFPIRVPITVALTPPIARFLARRRIIKTGV
ncbi:hypothetical protein FNV43_RR21817 [Rhamnella rubrinervis]|uniref:DUF1279 domain-containing protein n=1 Tax=Rhamnella rubrinervis TaxID=2594499 RepID=A0A8K0DP23_9ROSA|nr:hypothetical protein FNV43_RR21817 [Rhamnella rubrinervis]